MSYERDTMAERDANLRLDGVVLDGADIVLCKPKMEEPKSRQTDLA
jgi:hypothetical protein